MCGFVISVGSSLSRKDFMRATNSIVHRGPDETNFFYDDALNLSIGHNRLAIIDKNGGKQPMVSECKNYILAFNGEIYNHESIRTELEQKNIKFISNNSDTEVILRSYIYWGKSFINKLDGMFAIAIVDKVKKKILLYRDYFGEKPIYFYIGGQALIIGSELNVFREFKNIQLTLSAINLKKFLLFNFTPSPNTLFSEVRKVSNAELVEIRLDTLYTTRNKYYTYEKSPTSCKNSGEAIEVLDFMIGKSVKERLITDDEIGVLLSGGIDSTLISIYAKEISDKLVTFTAGIKEKTFDETDKAAHVAAFLGLENYNTTISNSNFANYLTEISNKIDDPIGATSLVPTYAVSKLAAKTVKSVIGGDGGDEIFGGFELFRFTKLFEHLKFLHKKNNLLYFLNKTLDFFPISSKNLSLDFKLRRLLRGYSEAPHLRNTMFLSSIDVSDVRDLFNEDVEKDMIFEEVSSFYEQYKHLNSYDFTILYYSNFYMPDLVCARADRGGMLNSLEIRSPLINKSIAEFFLNLDLKLKYNLFDTKVLLKKLLKYKLGKVQFDYQKTGLNIPLQDWLSRKTFNLLANSNMSSSSHYQEMINLHFAKKREYRNFLLNQIFLQKSQTDFTKSYSFFK